MILEDIDIQIFDDYITVNKFKIYVDQELRELLLEESKKEPRESAIRQFSSLQRLPGLIEAIGLPDIHAGYFFPIGSVAVVDMSDPDASISPEGVGYDINCGVRCLRTNMNLSEIMPMQHEIANRIYSKIPSGIGGSSLCYVDLKKLNGILDQGLKYLYEMGEIGSDEIEYTESGGSLKGNSRIVYQSAKGKGLNQIGSLGSGNHYLEIQVVESIFDEKSAEAIGIKEGQIIISIHTGSRGLGHSICENFMKDVKKDKKKFSKNQKADDEIIKDIKNKESLVFDEITENNRYGSVNINNSRVDEIVEKNEFSIVNDNNNRVDNTIEKNEFGIVNDNNSRVNNTIEKNGFSSINDNNSRVDNTIEKKISKSVNDNIDDEIFEKNRYTSINSDNIANDTIEASKKESIEMLGNEDCNWINFHSDEGAKYMSLMSSASNFAWANRAIITKKVGEALRDVFPGIEISLISDVSHNIAKIEKVKKDGALKDVIVHRKGASRILPPFHADLPLKYREIGQPVLIGGSMGTHSYIVVGAERCEETFLSTCHGAGRVISRKESKNTFNFEDVRRDMESKFIVVKSGSVSGIVEEAAGCYKNVNVVIDHSDRVGLTKKVARLKPVIVIKG